MKRKQILVGATILILMGILFIYGAYSASYGTGRWFSDRAKELFFSDIKLYIGIIFIGLGVFFWAKDFYVNRDKIIVNKKRKFSAEKLYKFVRNLIILISFLLLITSGIAFYIFKSSQDALNNIDSVVEFPSQYKELAFSSLDDYLNYVEPYSTRNFNPAKYQRYQTKEQIEMDEKIRKKNQEIEGLRKELRQMIKLPNGFNSALQLRNYRNKLSDEIEGSKAVSKVSLLSAILLQIIFWGIVWLYRYLFPLIETKNE